MTADAGNETREHSFTLAEAPIRKRLVLADDDPHVLEMVWRLLYDHYDIVGRASDGRMLVEQVALHSPDVAVVDLSMPELSGIEATRAITRSAGTVRVVILSVHDEPAYVEAAFDAGAHGYVLKLAAERELIPAIETVIAAGSYLSIGLR